MQAADDIVLCADTTVALGRRIMGKPADAVEAKAISAKPIRAPTPSDYRRRDQTRRARLAKGRRQQRAHEDVVADRIRRLPGHE